MVLALQITALASMAIITSLSIAGFIMFIGFCRNIKKQNNILSDISEKINSSSNNVHEIDSDDKKKMNV